MKKEHTGSEVIERKRVVPVLAQPLETLRLRLRRLTLDDATALFRTTGDPVVMRYLLGGADANIQATEQRIRALGRHWQEHAFGDWGIVHKQTGNIIGFGGLHYIPNMDEVNVGYALEAAYWRQGLASEACRIILRYGFEHRRFETIAALIWPENTASIKFIQALGFRRWKECVRQGQMRILYRKDRNDFT